MLLARRGRLSVRLAEGAGDVRRAQELRHAAFHLARGRSLPGGLDADAYDAHARHLLVEDGATLVGCCRARLMRGGELGESYAAGFYDMTPLAGQGTPLLELGRFCLAPDCHDPDVLRLAWAGVARMVDEAGAGMMIGCSSFAGADPARHAPALSFLAGRVGPPARRPGPLAPERVALETQPGASPAGLPPLLRSYLGLGGWVSDHAVIDRDMDTCHVFTAVEVAAIPPARAAALRAIGAEAMG